MITSLDTFQWSAIDVIMLDMDGTLLDRYFDDFFWFDYVPVHYSQKYAMTVDAAREQLLQRYKSKEGTLEWTDLDFWSDELGLDIPALKIQVDHLIQVHPYVVDFLNYCKNDLKKKLYLVTNAHSKTLAIKMARTAIGGYFDRIICSLEIGLAKEDVNFWHGLQGVLGFDPQRTLLADDNEAVLRAASKYGLGWLVYVARPSSRIPVQSSDSFASITYFNELIR